MDHTNLTQPEKSIKIALLGFGSSGKTYFLGSLRSLKYKTVKHAFSVKDKNSDENPRIEEIYSIINGTHEGNIFRTAEHEDIDIIFQQGSKSLFDITITDTEGQSLEPKFWAKDPTDRVKKAKNLSEKMPKYHGVLLLIKAPNDDIEFAKKQEELLHLLDFINKLKNEQPNTPVALVLTQIDRLKELTTVKRKIESVTTDGMKEYIENNSKSSKEDREDREIFLRRGAVNQEVLRLFPPKSQYLNSLITTFLEHIKHPEEDATINLFKVFPSSVLGFDNSMENPNDTNPDITKRTLIAKRTIEPYGVRVAFLWMVYKIIELREEDYHLFVPNFDFDKELISDTLCEMYTKGEAFSSMDYEDFEYSGLFDHKNL